MQVPVEQARRRRRVGVALTITVLVLGVAGSWAGAAVVRNAQHDVLAKSMDRDGEDAGRALTNQVNRYREALEDLATALATEKPLLAGDFADMTANMEPDRFPGATAVSFVVPVAHADVARAQATWRARGAKELVLRPVATQEDHDFVIYDRAIGDTAPAPGQDAAASPYAVDALRIARETRAATISAADVLLDDLKLPVGRRPMSFTMVVPVFDRAIPSTDSPVAGWLLMAVRGGAFLWSAVYEDTMNSEAKAATSQFRLSDPERGGAAIATLTDGTAIRDPSLVRQQTLAVGQHTWQVTIWPTTARLDFSGRWGGWLTLLVGLAITLLLVALVGVLATARNRALDRVDAATAALREDIRRREAVERELHWLAFHDQLTGLANRGLFYDRVGQALRSHVRSGQHFAVFFIDLDGFKQVNDVYGHGVGDHVLREVAVRIRECLRESDTAARFGGDEFAAILEGLSEPGDVHPTAERVIAAVQQPIDIGGREAYVSASVGIALNRPGDTADDIMREADMAMYTAKTTGKSRHVVAGDPHPVDQGVSTANSDLSPN